MTEDIKGFILSIVGIGLILTIGLIVIGQLGTSIAVGCSPYATNSTVWAETNATNTAVCQRLQCVNNTLGASGTGVYTINATRSGGCYNASTSADNLQSNWTTTQFPMAHSAAENSTTSIGTNLSTVPNWIGILITVALAFIVLGYFYNK